MSQLNSNNPNDGKKDNTVTISKGRLTVIIAATVGTVAIIAIVIAVMLLGGKKAEVVPDAAVTRGTVVMPENVEKIQKEIKEPVKDGYYETSMNVEWSFKNGKSPSKNAYVENGISNTRTVYFDVTLADTKELIYSSPYIPVGAKLNDFALDTKLAKGDYPAIVTYHLVDDENKEVSKVSVSIKLHILN